MILQSSDSSYWWNWCWSQLAQYHKHIQVQQERAPVDGIRGYNVGDLYPINGGDAGGSAAVNDAYVQFQL